MWKQVKTQSDIEELLLESQNFHDCCLHSMWYTSGAHVNNDGSMYPINDRRMLTLKLHQQGIQAKILQLRFEGLRTLFLSPTPPDFTCEFLESHVSLQDDEIIWTSEGLDVSVAEQRICINASHLSWEIKDKGDDSSVLTDD